MAAKIPFVRELEFEYGVPRQVSPLVRRVVANNPGPFTFTGTGVYIIGRGQVAVIDPGPDMPGHLDVLLRALEGETVSHIFVTHAHQDHSPAARMLAAVTGARIFACDTPVIPTESEVRMEAGDDLGFHPDVAVQDGEVFHGPGWTIEVVATPGHTSHHLAYALREENALFPGDHIMGWSTTVISPPDGNMTDYLNSLEKIRDRDYAVLYPTHGPEVREARAFVQAYLEHRLERERQVLAQLQDGPRSIREMVPAMYADVERRLHPAACHSVLAHVLRLLELGKINAHAAVGLVGIDTKLALA